MIGTMTGMKIVLCCIDKESWDTEGYLVSAINVIKNDVSKADPNDIAATLFNTISLSPEYKTIYDPRIFSSIALGEFQVSPKVWRLRSILTIPLRPPSSMPML